MPSRVNVRPIRRQLLTLVVIPVVSLIALWSYATYLTVGDGYRLMNQGRLINDVAQPAEQILDAIQGERRAAMVFLATPTTANQATMTGNRVQVDQRIATYRATLKRKHIQQITPDRIMRLAQAQLVALDRLADLRVKVDGQRITTVQLMDGYRDLVDPLSPLYAAVATFPDDQVSAEGQALQRLAHARELRARVDAVLAGTLASGGFTVVTYQQFVEAVGLMRAEYHETYVQMTEQYRQEMDAFFAREPFVSLTRMEDAAIATNGSRPIPVNADTWRDGNTTALSELADFQLDLAAFVDQHAKAPAYEIFGKILADGLLGLIAVIASIMVSLRIGRRLAIRLGDLSSSAHALADEQLPMVIERLRRGERVDVDAEAPLLDPGADEIGEVGGAFNSVRRTAIRSAVDEAELREGISNVFLNIARRSQTLVRQQLTMLDVMERKTVNPDDLSNLFKVDHLATRMRRYAENLVILGGNRSSGAFSQPVVMQDVLRGAASEAEQYERVRVLPVPAVLLAGSLVSDVIHLVAELIDNATRFSPPHTAVQVFGQPVPHGFAIEVEDRGLGMTAVDLTAANGWLADPPEFSVLALSESPRLGMFVVARIAARHGIKVSLRRSAFGGVTAVVLLPPEMIIDETAEDAPAGATAVAEPAVATGTEDQVPAGPAEDAPAAGPAAGAREALDREPVGAGVGAAAGGAVAPAGDTMPLPMYSSGRDPLAVHRPDPAGPIRGAAAPVAPGYAPLRSVPPAGPPPDEEPRTHLGLPVRVRQAGLAPGLRDAPEPNPTDSGQPVEQRCAEEVRRMMSAYQRGTERGRQAIIDPDESSTIDSASTAAAERAGEES